METHVIFAKAAKDALGGGLPGAAAMAAQVTSLMWLRTIVNYQYRYGGTMSTAARALYAQGGIRRFYAGYPAAIFQAPLSRFGDTAANAGVMSLLNSLTATQNWPLPLKTACASLCAGAIRIVLMPIDTLKTVMQVEGSQRGWRVLREKMQQPRGAGGGVGVLFHGALGASAATFAGHYPWFLTYNFLNAHLPQAGTSHRMTHTPHFALVRAAFIGFCASIVSDSISNSMRVVKTTKQTSAVPISYTEALGLVLAKDGWRGVMGRGLKTKLLSNGVQGLMFSVLWKIGQDHYRAREAEVQEH